MASKAMQIHKDCPWCKKPQTLELPVDGFFKWKAGALVQDALPMLTPDQREVLLTGICTECWAKMGE